MAARRQLVGVGSLSSTMWVMGMELGGRYLSWLSHPVGPIVLFYLFKTFKTFNLCMGCACAIVPVHVTVRGQFAGVSSLLLPVGQIQVSRLAYKCLYLWSHLAGSIYFILFY